MKVGEEKIYTYIENSKLQMEKIIDSYEDKVLSNNNYLIINGSSYYLKSKENAKDLKEEIESYLIKEDVKYELKEIQSGKNCDILRQYFIK